jgi:hypothetical protein
MTTVARSSSLNAKRHQFTGCVVNSVFGILPFCGFQLNIQKISQVKYLIYINLYLGRRESSKS